MGILSKFFTWLFKIIFAPFILVGKVISWVIIGALIVFVIFIILKLIGRYKYNKLKNSVRDTELKMEQLQSESKQVSSKHFEGLNKMDNF